MLNKLRLYGTQVAWARRNADRYAREHCEWFRRMREKLTPWIADFRGVRTLDVGCGLLLWQTVLLHSAGAKVTGIDTEYVRADRRPDKYLRVWKLNGLERAVKTAGWDYLYSKRYRRALQACAPYPLNFRGLDLRRQPAEQLPFANGEFDLVVSHEVFEHIADVPAAVAEVKRVLKPGGIAYVNVHLFPSISGGHNMEWKYPDTEPSLRVPPWDHLRERRFNDHPSWINELREHDYRNAFERAFEILSWEPSAWEGRMQLTPEIRAELSEYSEEELLKKGVIIVARKQAE